MKQLKLSIKGSRPRRKKLKLLNVPKQENNMNLKKKIPFLMMKYLELENSEVMGSVPLSL